MKILLLGKGISNQGVAYLFDEKKIAYDMLDTSEVKNYNYELVVKSPGISNKNEVVQKLKAKNIQIISDIELVFNFLKPKTIALTGSNGKTTTLNYLYHMLKSDYKVSMCGNIGVSFARTILDNPYNDYYLLELSSFQLQDVVNFAPNISILLNINPCHLDYHENYLEYINAKRNITINQTSSDYLIYNYDDENIRMIACDSEAKKISFSLESTLANCYLYLGYIYLDGYKILNTKKIKLKGNHNILNVMASICVSKVLGVKNKKIKKAVKEFSGVNYRITEEVKGIYNDAKSTNPYSTIEAIKTIGGKIDLICGGYNRGEYLDALIPYINVLNNIYVYGQTRFILKDFFNKYNKEVIINESLKESTLLALKNRDPEINILYSPMFASYDQYKSYNERGEEFSNYLK